MLFLLLALLALAVVIVAVAVASVLFWRNHARERAAFYASLASRLGFDIAAGARPPDEAASPGAHPDFAAHGADAVRRRRHLVRGWGAAVLRIGDVKKPGETLEDLTLATLEDPGLDLPLFTVRPRGAFGAPGQRAIGFDEDLAFQQTFEVFGPDPAAVRAVLARGVREALTAHGEGWYWEAHGPSLGVTGGSLADLGEAEGLLDGLQAVAQALRRR